MSLLAVALCVVLRYRLPDAIACMLTIDLVGLGTSHMENSSHTILFVLSILERQSAMATQLRLAMSAWTFVDATSHHLLGILTNYVMLSAVRALFLEEASSQIHGIDPLLPFLSLNLTYILYSKIE